MIKFPKIGINCIILVLGNGKSDLSKHIHNKKNHHDVKLVF